MTEPVDGKLHRRSTFSPLRVFAGVVVLLAILVFVLSSRSPRGHIAACKTNLRYLIFTFDMYAQEYGNVYPTAEEWCDLLIDTSGPETKRFLHCPGGKNGRCDYAMNPHADPNSAGDVVLLFESRPGWNQAGGPELLTMGNHEIKGCNVLFVDGTVKFIKAEDVNVLKWEDEGTPPSEPHDQQQNDEE